MKTLKLEHIRIDGGTQARAEINEGIVYEYSDDMQQGAVFPPVVVFHDGTDYWLADGFHRYHASHKGEFKDITVDVHTGTRQDAIKYALGANQTNGLRRTSADKRNSVEIALREFGDLSDRALGEICGVDGHTVAAMREATTCGISAPARIGKDGKKYPASKPKSATNGNTSPAPATEPRAERISYIPDNGMQYAEHAIIALEKIQLNDTKYEDALLHVQNWIKQRLAVHYNGR